MHFNIIDSFVRRRRLAVVPFHTQHLMFCVYACFPWTIPQYQQLCVKSADVLWKKAYKKNSSFRRYSRSVLFPFRQQQQQHQHTKSSPLSAPDFCFFFFGEFVTLPGARSASRWHKRIFFFPTSLALSLLLSIPTTKSVYMLLCTFSVFLLTWFCFS